MTKMTNLYLHVNTMSVELFAHTVHSLSEYWNLITLVKLFIELNHICLYQSSVIMIVSVQAYCIGRIHNYASGNH